MAWRNASVSVTTGHSIVVAACFGGILLAARSFTGATPVPTTCSFVLATAFLVATCFFRLAALFPAALGFILTAVFFITAKAASRATILSAQFWISFRTAKFWIYLR